MFFIKVIFLAFYTQCTRSHPASEHITRPQAGKTIYPINSMFFYTGQRPIGKLTRRMRASAEWTILSHNFLIAFISHYLDNYFDHNLKSIALARILRVSMLAGLLLVKL